MFGYIHVSKIIGRMHSRNWYLSVEVFVYFDNYPEGHFRKDKLFRRSGQRDCYVF